jgi:hypothetical protein
VTPRHFWNPLISCFKTATLSPSQGGRTQGCGRENRVASDLAGRAPDDVKELG